MISPLSPSLLYPSDSIGIAWVTFDQTTGTRGSATPRIFVGVASVGKDNIFVSENAGTTCKVDFPPSQRPENNAMKKGARSRGLTTRS